MTNEATDPLPLRSPRRICVELLNRLVKCCRCNEEAPTGLPLLHWINDPGLRGFSVSVTKKLEHKGDYFGNRGSDTCDIDRGE